MAAPMEDIRVLELYSGIGGMHYALKASGLNFHVIQAMDVNTNANEVYKHNFPDTKINSSSIEALTSAQWSAMKVDMVLMSPPCQPFTRVGKQQDVNDVRTRSFLHILHLIEKIEDKPSYILVENVKGFDASESRQRLLDTLNRCGYNVREYLLTPLQFGIPNSRLRYFLIAKKQPLSFHFDNCLTSLDNCGDSPNIQTSLPQVCVDWMTFRQKALDEPSEALTQSCCCGAILKQERIDSQNKTSESGESSCKRIKLDNKSCSDSVELTSEVVLNCDTQSGNGLTCICLENYGRNMRQSNENDPLSHKPCLPLHCFLKEDNMSDEEFEKYKVPDKDLKRFVIMDLVNPCSKKTNCFTKRYGHYVEGAGSVVLTTQHVKSIERASVLKGAIVLAEKKHDWTDEDIEVVRCLHLRYFTPREIANILCFPADLGFPDSLSTRQLYMLLGNSLNVHIVSVLLRLLTVGDNVS
ncbi:tRNA (cytosine(38)-C(5))-methyltransferase-like isoform X2 [Mya arenaria]|uniref:tRNA (cytosine(38)-C(5))-methyltransferase-like isoform X2 n=1 Tax=Mya arenaria TaxID=6604 RepID=UPI0022E007BF|nr:tRNA (cytosine(38)-C(5))-methyltransferase-like isoform X2 [Mya arenaria]